MPSLKGPNRTIRCKLDFAQHICVNIIHIYGFGRLTGPSGNHISSASYVGVKSFWVGGFGRVGGPDRDWFGPKMSGLGLDRVVPIEEKHDETCPAPAQRGHGFVMTTRTGTAKGTKGNLMRKSESYGNLSIG